MICYCQEELYFGDRFWIILTLFTNVLQLWSPICLIKIFTLFSIYSINYYEFYWGGWTGNTLKFLSTKQIGPLSLMPLSLSSAQQSRSFSLIYFSGVLTTLSPSQIHLAGFYELLHHQAWLQAEKFEKSSCFHLCWHCCFHSCKRCLRKFQNQGGKWSGDPIQSWDFTVGLAINSSWENSALDKLEPSQPNSCCYQGMGYEGEMKLQARFSTPYVWGLLKALDFM